MSGPPRPGVGDPGLNHGVIVDVLPGEVFVEVTAYLDARAFRGEYDVRVYTVGPRGGQRPVERAGSSEELRRAADVRLRAADATDEYIARVTLEHPGPA